eukprot:scpid97448/ scgid23785/ 
MMKRHRETLLEPSNGVQSERGDGRVTRQTVASPARPGLRSVATGKPGHSSRTSSGRLSPGLPPSSRVSRGDLSPRSLGRHPRENSKSPNRKGTPNKTNPKSPTSVSHPTFEGSPAGKRASEIATSKQPSKGSDKTVDSAVQLTVTAVSPKKETADVDTEVTSKTKGLGDPQSDNSTSAVTNSVKSSPSTASISTVILTAEDRGELHEASA